MSRSSINFNFRQAREKAEELENIADDLKRMSSQKLQSSFQNLSSSWKGTNADAYLAKGAALQGDIVGTASQLCTIAATIRQVAQRIYEAEMEALEAAEERNY